MVLGKGVDLRPVDVVDGNAEGRHNGVLDYHAEEGLRWEHCPSLING